MLTAEQRGKNLAWIAEAAVKLEQETGIPAELPTGQVILETGWLEHAPGNNPFGMKAPEGAKDYQLLETPEELTDAQIRRVAASGRRIVAMGPKMPNGKRKVRILDKFRRFDTLPQAFLAYGRLLLEGTYFRARMKRYFKHRDLDRLLADMGGADDLPPYWTDSGYIREFKRITNQANVKAALAKARAANSQP